MNIKQLLKIDKDIILASQSPRRKQLLEMLGFEFEVAPSTFHEEGVDLTMSPKDYVVHLAEEKAKEVASRLSRDAIYIAADTIVVLDERIINKPANKAEAYSMLKRLSANSHFVFTGVSIINGEKQISDFVMTEVKFRKIHDEEINAYIETGSPMDKAGAYGIQDDFGAVFVESINGCYYNIVGFPLEKFYKMLKSILK